MRIISKLAAAAVVLLAVATDAGAAEKVTISIGGASCLCYMPTVLAKQIGAYEKAGIDADLVDFKGGSQSLTAVLGGSADVVSGYFDHTVKLAAKNQRLQSFVVYDQFPGLVLAVAPDQTGKIKSVKDLAGKKVGVTAPGSSTDFFLKFLLQKNGIDPTSAAVIGVGLGATAVAAMEQGQIDAVVTLDPAVTVLQAKHKDLTILADTRTQKDTEAVFGGDYPGGALYTRPEWMAAHPQATQGLTNAMLATLDYIHSHSAEEIMAQIPDNLIGSDKDAYLAALKNAIPMYSTTGLMDPKGAQAVLDVFSLGSPDVANAKIDITQTYTNDYVNKAKKAN
ncbi:transporter substrate-binding domain-containing protein [Mesorhizobium sp. B2-3-7]|nr:transporter substrate-binding domain-containing protein [Mesorhizobium sp. B2-3-8]TPM18085.1 transporter substrate-binding domain-containing protein [Mesorhizobium sp. B2-3-7]